MKPRIFILPTLLGSFCLSGLQGETVEPVRTPPTSTVATLPAPVVEVAPPQQPVPKPDFKIESTQVKLIDVVEAPPMVGLPPVEGTMTLTVHGVADPGLPDPPPPASPAAYGSQATVEPDPESANQKDMGMVLLSATVYDHKRTLLRCNIPGGTNAGEITAWSNLDFNHFCDVGNFEATGANRETRSYSLIMGIGNESAGTSETEIPTIPDGTPAFKIVTENPAPEAVKLIEDLHALYRSEGTKMAQAAAAREQATEEKKAYLLAHPPKPKDVTVNFWKRENAETQAPEGAQP